MTTKEIIKEKLRNKKGILIFDMDGVLNGIIESKNKDTFNNYYLDSTSLEYLDDKEEDEQYIAEGISKNTVDYLMTLKDDYVLMTNTSWHPSTFLSLQDFPISLFDIYGGKAGNELFINLDNKFENFIDDKLNDESYNNVINTLVTDSKREKGNSHLLNKFIFDIIQEMKSDNNLSENFRMIQFEDEWNGSLETSEYVFMNFNNNITINDNENFEIDRYTSPINIYGENSIEFLRKSFNSNNKTYTTEFTKDGDAVMRWLKNNLK